MTAVPVESGFPRGGAYGDRVREMAGGWPYWVTYVFFLSGSLVRSHATYAVGMGLRAGGRRTRWGRHLDRPSVAAAERLVARLGPVAVVISFLTVGVQSAINAAAGAMRMPLRRYSPAAFVGSLVWAAIYTTVGFALVDAALGRVPWWWVAVAAGLVLGVLLVTRRVRRASG